MQIDDCGFFDSLKALRLFILVPKVGLVVASLPTMFCEAKHLTSFKPHAQVKSPT
jgi:hypothetical protein